MKGKVSVSDDGTVAAFVSTGSYIKAINLNPANTNERNISNYAEWDNVAISKDGNRLAAISTEIDTAIYVFDLESDPIRGVKYHLYNPTTSNTNTDAGGVLYADAIEFDNTGENLIYDAYNVLNSNTAEDIYYWDIGFINVWDNNLKNFGTGEINKLYGSLPEKVSIGNPVFSKNSPYIIAFDYFDSYNDVYAIMGANLLTGDLDIIADNTIIGYPCYSKEDNKVAYSTMSNSANVVAVKNLGTNKISGTGSPVLLVQDAKWPVFYSTGVRDLGLEPVSNFTVDYMEGKAPLKVQFFDLSTNDPTSWNWTFEGGTPSTSASQNPVITFSTPGTYAVSLTAANSTGNNTKAKDDYIIVSLGTGVDDTNPANVSFYPNPVTDILKISCETEFIVWIRNIQGALILQSENRNEIDLSGLDAGIYIIEIKTGEGTLTKKMVKL
jgi:PKD repeat protein